MSLKRICFTKMHGAGNDYIYIDISKYPIAHPEDVARRWSLPHTGIGSDGLILVGPSDKADFFMHMYNKDGSEGIMCGNGIRCVGKFVYDHSLTNRKDIKVETLGGIKHLQLQTNAENKVQSVTVDMGAPILQDRKLLANTTGELLAGKIQCGNKEYEGTFVSMGNPHFVIFVEDIQQIDLAYEGAELENHPLFPQKCNIEFAEIRPGNIIRTRVWERGSGITQACGTGACATLVAAKLNNKCPGIGTIAMDGGNLEIEWREKDNHIYMTGPATTVFEGEIEIEQTI